MHYTLDGTDGAGIDGGIAGAVGYEESVVGYACEVVVVGEAPNGDITREEAAEDIELHAAVEYGDGFLAAGVVLGLSDADAADEILGVDIPEIGEVLGMCGGYNGGLIAGVA